MNEKMKTRWQWHIVLLAVLLMLFSILCWLGFAKSVAGSLISRMNPAETARSTETAADEPAAQTVQAQGSANKLSRYLEKIDRITDAVDTRWYGNMFQKSGFSKMDSVFTYYTTGEIASSQVMRGSGEWLFYKSATDGSTISDYEGTNLYSPEELDEILETTLSIQNKMEARGIRFALLFAPNKETLYSRYMPDSYKYSPVNRTGELTRKLQENGVNAHFPMEALLKDSEEYRLYYSNDTHWNQLGAYVGSKEVLASWGIEMPGLANREISAYPLSEYHHYGASADLAQIAGLTFAFDDEEEYLISGTKSVDWAKLGEEQDSGQISYFSNEDAMLDATLFLVGDSFRVSMIPSLAEIFSDIHVIHRSFYNSSMLDEIDPDYLIVQIVERYSDAVRHLDVLI